MLVFNNANSMTRMIYCHKLKKECEGLDKPPYANELGQRIYNDISKEAWQAWLKRQTMLINEYRLSAVDPNARKFLMDEMKKFLFENDESTIPAGYVPPSSQSHDR